jgi:hypothetical protein
LTGSATVSFSRRTSLCGVRGLVMCIKWTNVCPFVRMIYPRISFKFDPVNIMTTL